MSGTLFERSQPINSNGVSHQRNNFICSMVSCDIATRSDVKQVIDYAAIVHSTHTAKMSRLFTGKVYTQSVHLFTMQSTK